MIDYEKRKKKARKYQKELKEMLTLSEFKFKGILDEMGISYYFQKKIFTQDSFFITDFYLKKSRIVIEIDGGYHNNRFEHDKKRDEELFKSGKGKVRLVVHFTNDFIENKNNRNMIKKEIQNLIERKGKFYEGLIKYKSEILNKAGNEKAKAKWIRKRERIREELIVENGFSLKNYRARKKKGEILYKRLERVL